MAEDGRETSLVGDRHDNRDVDQMASEIIQDNHLTAEQAVEAADVGVFQVKLIILSGFVWMARGFDFIIHTSIISLITCTWNLKRWHGALMKTITILSATLGCYVYGIWSDYYGRRTAVSSSLIFLFVFGAVAAGLPSYTWFLIFRAVASFGVGGLPQALVLCCEYMPNRQRGRALYVLACFWALGTVIMLCVLYMILNSDGNWRLFVAVGSLPAFVAMVMMRFFPESFRFLLVNNQYFFADQIFAEMAETNGKIVTGHLLHLPEGGGKRRIVTDLLKPPLTRPTLLFWLMGLATSISFLGLNTITQPLVLQGPRDFKPTNISTSNFIGDQQQAIPCMDSMGTEDFIFMIWTTALDFPGYIIYLILVDMIDRKRLLCVSYFISSLFIFLLCIPALGVYVYVIFVYCSRILLVSQFDLLLLMTAETFPTSHRGTAVGLTTSSFYLGQFFSSYIVQSLLWISFMYPIILYGILTFLCSVAAICLQHETRGRILAEKLK